ncbi:MAG: NUDIX domain-containing protein [Acidimicrobiales bacterium]
MDPFGTTISGVPGNRRRQRIAAYGVCRDDAGRILLARASPAITLQGRWFLPGGGVDHGESPTESLTREMHEESGLVVSVGPLLDVLSDVRTIPDGTSLHTVRIIYEVTSWSGTLRPEVDGTTDAVGWFTPEEVRDMPLAHYVQIVVDRLV